MELCKQFDMLEKVEKIIVTEDMLSLIEQTYLAYISNFVLKHDFDQLNIELLISPKINIFIENSDNDAMITVFNNEKVVLYFEFVYITDETFSIGKIYYDESVRCDFTKAIMFTLNWYKKILFYKQWHTIDSNKHEKNTTFFINTNKNKLKEKKSS